MESLPALPFPQSRGKGVDKVGGGVYNVSGEGMESLGFLGVGVNDPAVG